MAAHQHCRFEVTLQSLYASQDTWMIIYTVDGQCIGPLLQNLGLNLARLQNDATALEVTALATCDLADAQTLKVTMTPEYFVNGKPLPQFGFDELKKLVEDALAQHL